MTWLIEHRDCAKWLMPGIATEWTTDAWQALQCATEDEARAIIRHPDFDLRGICTPTEHVFVGSQSATSGGK